MNDYLRKVDEFLRKFSQHYDGPPRVLPEDLAEFRQVIMKEELDEYIGAFSDAARALAQPSLFPEDGTYVTECLGDGLDALADLMYVLCGTILIHGLGPHFDEAFRRVHAANMTKIRATAASQSKRNSAIDVIKPPDFQPPVHTDLIEEHAHR